MKTVFISQWDFSNVTEYQLVNQSTHPLKCLDILAVLHLNVAAARLECKCTTTRIDMITLL